MATDLYRLYTGELEVELTLLYVGISQDARSRWQQHRRRPFWEFVTYATVTTYSSRWAAEVVEAHAILTEEPLLNIDKGARWARAGDARLADDREFLGYFETTIGRAA